jgi:Flp pilus assembly pilin Flp
MAPISQHRQRGLTAVEYAVAGGIIVVALVAALTPFGEVLKAAFDSMLSYLN